MKLYDVHFEYPQLLGLLLAVPLIVWLLQFASRSGASSVGRWISSIVRGLAIAAGVAALALPSSSKQSVPAVQPSVIILQDSSPSMAGDYAVETRRDQIVSAVSRKLPVKTYRFSDKLLSDAQPSTENDQTDIERSLDELGAQFAEMSRIDVVLITDGRSTRGSAEQAAARLALRGAHVHVIPAGVESILRPRILDTEPPTDARLGLTSAIRITIESSARSASTLTLIDPTGRAVDARSIDAVTYGQQTLILRFVPATGGLNRYKVELKSDGVIADQLVIPIYVESPPRILLADNFPDEAVALKAALSPLQMPVDLIHPDNWPVDLSAYAAIIISDFSGNELNDDQRLSVKTFVETNGAGLVCIGGGNVVSSRWQNGLLAELLPVHFRPRPANVIKQEQPVSVCYVFDRSGSMGEILPGSTAGVSKLELVKAAVIASIQSLPSSAQAAVIAFDTQPDVFVSPTSVANKEQISHLVDSIGIGGGTDIYPALEKGIALLDHMEGGKYLILLTDGQTLEPPNGRTWDGLADEAARKGVSLTSIAVGLDADQGLLKSLANRGNGRYAYCGTGDQIPKVFVDQTKIIKRISELQQQAFAPRAGPDVNELGELKSAQFPQLLGNVPADVKLHGHVQLMATEMDVLLADWQFGAGRVVSFCSDIKSAWAGSWLNWPEFSAFWVHILSSVARVHPPLRATVHSVHKGDHYQYTFQVTDEDGKPATDLECTSVIDPAKQHGSPVEWRRLQPGMYRAEFIRPNDQLGYQLSMMLHRKDRRGIQYVVNLSSDTNQELSATGPDLQACEELAFAGQGVCSVDCNMVVQSILARPADPPVIIQRPLWPYLLAIMLCLWPFDVWGRKLF